MKSVPYICHRFGNKANQNFNTKKMTREQSKLINDLKEARDLIYSIMNQLDDSVLIDDENPFGIVKEDSIEEKLMIADSYLRTVLNQVEPNPYL